VGPKKGRAPDGLEGPQRGRLLRPVQPNGCGAARQWFVVLLTTQSGCGASLTASASGLSEDMSIVCSASGGASLRPTARPSCRHQGHNNCVRTVAFSFDGKVVASGGDDNKIILWDPKKGERLMELKGHSAQINGVR
jgi:WD40 repeat protein